MLGAAPVTSFATLASSSGEDWKVEVLDAGAIQKKVKDVVEAQEQLNKEV